MKGAIAFVTKGVIIVACVYFIFSIYLYIFQSRYVYYPEGNTFFDPRSIGLDFESIEFKTADAVKLRGWFVPNDAGKAVILFCHGNAGNISHRLDSIEIFHKMGLDVFIFDYRGYGESEGKPSERGTYEDAEAAWRYLVETRRVDPSRVIVFGRSLGGAVASWLAHKHKPGILILESSFTSIRDIAATLYPYLPVRWLLRFDYNTEEYLRKVECPVLVIHSRNDEMMPFSHGRRLFEIAKEPKRFVEISGTHNEGFITSGKLYEEGLNGFVQEYMNTDLER